MCEMRAFISMLLMWHGTNVMSTLLTTIVTLAMLASTNGR
jgi:hypothetical protein